MKISTLLLGAIHAQAKGKALFDHLEPIFALKISHVNSFYRITGFIR